MDVEESADAVPGAVLIIEPDLPQRLARQHIQRRTCCGYEAHCKTESVHGAGRTNSARGEDGLRERDVALQDACEGRLFELRRLAQVQGARDVSRAVSVLAARVDQVDLLLRYQTCSICDAAYVLSSAQSTAPG